MDRLHGDKPGTAGTVSPGQQGEKKVGELDGKEQKEERVVDLIVDKVIAPSAAVLVHASILEKSRQDMGKKRFVEEPPDQGFKALGFKSNRKLNRLSMNELWVVFSYLNCRDLCRVFPSHNSAFLYSSLSPFLFSVRCPCAHWSSEQVIVPSSSLFGLL